ncbi:arg8-vasotocin receptor-like [Babylonia areolata]|uniref:arg8-vasotocin receptor-like n=1 Tax=Babylonia areolata TaxID=304850 RepID=UPI003FD1F334
MDVAGIDVITPTDVTANDTTGQRYTPASTPRELHYYHVVYLSLAIAVGVPGNLLVLVAYAVVKVKTSCDWYILHIAVLDLIVCLFRVPTHLAMETGHWRQHGSDALCKFVYWLSQSVITASVILFAFIAIDRYIKVCKPTVQITARFSRNCVVLISGLSLLSALPTFWVYADTAQGQCTVVISLLGFVYVKNYYTVLFVGFLAMLVVVVVCYALIIVKVRNSQQIMKAHQDRQTREKGARLTQATQGNQVGVTNVEHIVPPCKASPPTATKPSSHQEAESASHAMATSLLHPPMKAWQENDNHVHEKTRGVERSSEATTTPLCQENAVFSFNPNTDSAPYLQKSAQEDTIDTEGKANQEVPRSVMLQFRRNRQ